jgi:hypothetical protein
MEEMYYVDVKGILVKTGKIAIRIALVFVLIIMSALTFLGATDIIRLWVKPDNEIKALMGDDGTIMYQGDIYILNLP